MGLVGGLLLLPITAPVRGFQFLLESLREEADAVLHDEGRAFAELIDLSMRRSAGQLSEAEFAEQETLLLERLGALREYRDELLQDELETSGDDAPLDDATDIPEDDSLDDETDIAEEDASPWDDADVDEEGR